MRTEQLIEDIKIFGFVKKITKNAKVFKNYVDIHSRDIFLKNIRKVKQQWEE